MARDYTEFARRNKKRKPGSASDARSGNPTMGKYKGKSGYAIPYSDDTNRSPYKRGNRGGYPH